MRSCYWERMEKETHQNLAGQILKKHVGVLKKGKKRRTLDKEVVHDMRVATRRLRAALKTFKTVLPPRTNELGRELQKLGRLLGKRRDLDVFLDFIKTLDGERSDFPKLVKKQAQAEKKILAMLKSTHFAHLLTDLENLQQRKSFNLRQFAKKQIRKAFHKVLEMHVDQELHPLRIRLKKLRYTCEFFTSQLGLDKWIEKTKKVQDLLGEHQDAITGLSILKRYQKQFSSEQYKKIKDGLKCQEKNRRKSFTDNWKRYCNQHLPV